MDWQTSQLRKKAAEEKAAQKEHERVLKMIPKKAEALARMIKKARGVSYSHATGLLTVRFDGGQMFFCRGEIVQRVLALVPCEEVTE